VKLFRSARAKSLIVEDVYFRDSARWSYNILLSEDVRFTNVKLVNCMIGHIGDWTNNHKFPPVEVDPLLFHIPVVTNLDGYDIDASTNVVVEESFIFTGDDAFTPKVTGYMDLVAPCRNIIMRRNVIWTEKAALKIGPEAEGDLDNMLFIDNHIIRADRFFSARIDGKPGVKIHNVVVKNNRTEEVSGNYFERLFRFHMAHEGAIINLVVDGLDTLEHAPQSSTSEGFSPEDLIAPVSIKNIRLKGEPIEAEAVFRSVSKISNSSIVYDSVPLKTADTAEVP
jgi:polygalacturonase